MSFSKCSLAIASFGFLLGFNSYHALAQTPNPLDFFPHHVGNVWQYRSMFTGQVTATERIVRDSIGQNGSRYIWFPTGFGFDAPMEIDTLYQVWELAIDSLRTRGRRPYKLDALLGERWAVNLTPRPRDTAHVIGLFPSVVFGQPVTVKEISYWQRFSPRDSLWYGTRYMATGFGMVQFDIEPSDVWYLAGAIINGVHWGVILDVDEIHDLPKEVLLHGNYPNPFNPLTTIKYDLPSATFVRLEVFDVLGNRISSIVNETQEAGVYRVRFDGSAFASGTYFCRLQAGGYVRTTKMILMK